jgi:magnesium transporter
LAVAGRAKPEGVTAVTVADVELPATAAELAVSAVPRAEPLSRAGDIREALAGEPFETAIDVAVCDDGLLLGLVPIERVLAADAGTQLGELLDETRVVVAAATDREQVAWRVARDLRRSAAVVDEHGRFLGVVPPETLLRVLLHEHEEDVARLGGLRASTSLARAASEEPVRRRLWHRFPWLVIGLLGAMVSAVIVGAFEEQIREEVLLALFVPAVVYMADAVGTQTEAVVIRGIAVGVSIRDIVWRELAAGAIIGVLIGATFFAFALAVWGNGRIAATVAIALFISSSIATLVAMVLPYALARLGQDPAFGSGPLATVIQDLLSIVVYFVVGISLLP